MPNPHLSNARSNRPRHRPQSDHRRSRSPLIFRGKSPRRIVSPWKSTNLKNSDDKRPRGRYRQNERRNVNTKGPDNNIRATRDISRNNNRNRKWGRANKKKKNRGARRGGGMGPPVSGGNRQPIASMRMRMDDYLPRSGRLLPHSKNNDIEHTMARARREASTRTKDTFWTKKLLDAETSHPNRWAHSGFKEMYREELGYSDIELKNRGDDKMGGRSSVDRIVIKTSKNAKTPPGRRSIELHQTRSQRGLKADGRKDSHSRSSPRSKGDDHKATRSSNLKPRSRKRTYSRSYSRSLSSFSSNSDSDSRSYSVYSRSSSTGSTSSTSSSFTSSSSGSFVSYSKRSFSRRSYSSGSWSRSPSPKRQMKVKPPITQKVRPDKIQETKKKVMTKTVAKAKKSTYTSISSGSKLKSKASNVAEKPMIGSKNTPSKIQGSSVSHNPSSEYYDPSVITEDSPPPMAANRLCENISDKGSSHFDSESRRLSLDTDIDAEIHKHPVVSDPRLAAEADPRRITKAKKSESRRTASKKSKPVTVESNSQRPPSNSSIRKGLSDACYKKPSELDARRAADIQRYKNSRLTRNTYQEKKTILHPSGIRLKRERKSHSESSSEDEEFPTKLTLSERFGKLAQLSSQRQEYEGVRMKIVREGGQDKKVYLEGGGSRTPSPFGRHDDGAHERWLREHKAEYDEYEERYGEFRQWDPHRDLPRELPPNWDDINVRYRYYKESGYFGDRAITMDDYLKWEEWWYRYKDWLEKYGGLPEAEAFKFRGGPDYDIRTTSGRWSRREKDDRKRIRYQ